MSYSLQSNQKLDVFKKACFFFKLDSNFYVKIL